MSKPIIAIGGTYDQASPSSAFPTLRRIFTNEGYVSKLEQSGASVIVIPNTNDNIDTLISLCDGLLLAGGPDIEPSLYQQERQAVCGASDIASDHFQIALYHAARREGKPILGICRGCQLINVAEGGTLFQDYRIRGDHSILHPDLEHFDKVSHTVTVYDGTKLSTIVKTKELGVNSLHHQCIDMLAPSLQCSARSSDGCIEAIELSKGAWVLGVQWHPESMQEEMLPLFRAFVDAAKTHE
ncbi:MAG: gamma-glutamyl-gamma-aminobutyrate hydrolase family protein [Sphaerochaetaceae bacterium]